MSNLNNIGLGHLAPVPPKPFASRARAFGENSILKNDLLENKCPKIQFFVTNEKIQLLVRNYQKRSGGVRAAIRGGSGGRGRAAGDRRAYRERLSGRAYQERLSGRNRGIPVL